MTSTRRAGLWRSCFNAGQIRPACKEQENAWALFLNADQPLGVYSFGSSFFPDTKGVRPWATSSVPGAAGSQGHPAPKCLTFSAASSGKATRSHNLEVKLTTSKAILHPGLRLLFAKLFPRSKNMTCFSSFNSSTSLWALVNPI